LKIKWKRHYKVINKLYLTVKTKQEGQVSLFNNN